MVLDRLYREAQAAVPPVELAVPAAGSAPGVQVGSPEQQLAAARSTLASLELRYKPDHPDIIRTKSQIQALEAQVSAAGTTAPIGATLSTAELQRRERLGQMAAELESIDRQIVFRTGEEKRLRDEIAEYQRRVEAVPGLESEWVALTRDYDTQQIAYKELLAKSGAAKVALDLEEQQIGEHFRIVDPANVPVRPLPSIRVRLNAVGLALGLFLGLGIAALLEFRDSSYRTDAEVVDILSLPVLASVPYVVTDRERRHQTRRAVAFSAVGLAGLAGAGYVVWAMKLWQSVI
jgi:polysaccharide biosynthesis transport protein